MVTTDPLLRVENLKKHFPVNKGLILMKTVGYVQAVDGISFSIKQGEPWGWWENRVAEKPRPAN